jgi:hypothetical protein
MPKIEKKAEEANSEPMIPLDDSGPAVDVELPKPKASEVKEKEKEVEVKEVEEVEEVKEKKEEPVVAPTANAKKEIKKDELDDYSANVKKRIEKLTFKLREAERREKAATDYAESVKTRFDDLDKNYLQQASDRVKSETEKSKELLKKAIEEGDADKIVDLNQQIATLAVDDARVKAAEENAKVNKKTKPAETTEEAIASDQPPQPDPKAEAWAAKNSWFGSNEAMTYTAFAIHKKLVEQEGFDPHSDTYYEEVDKRIRDEFPHKFDGEKADTGQQKPAQAVASATRSTKTGRKTVRLTPSQVAIAKKLGVPLEEYAKYVKEDN